MQLYHRIYRKLVMAFLLLPLLLHPALADISGYEEIHLENDWGIEPVSLHLTAAGFMIEFRYKILDIDKALVLSDRKDFPMMLSMKSKARFSVPYGSTVGYLKSNRRFLKEGKNYIAMFSNENRHMLAGDQIRIKVRNQVTPPLTIKEM